MKLLADTSVWSLALRRKSGATLNAEEQRLQTELSEAVENGSLVMMGPIRQEVLSGIKDQAQFEQLRVALQAFRDEPLDTPDHEAAARLYNVCCGCGLECGPVDTLICAVALRRRWQIVTNDRVMKECLVAIASEPR